MDYYLLAYITQRMNEMGFPKFHFEAVHAFVEDTKMKIEAYNQFYYLVSKAVPASLVIASDTNIFIEAGVYSSYNFYQVQEFTGLIEISQTLVFVDLEFIKVVPVYDCKQLKLF